jgi:hypothetical protein
MTENTSTDDAQSCQTSIIGTTAKLIHYDLSLKAMALMIEKDDMKVEDFRELPEVKRIWSAMDVIQEYYL